jgi:hypothetical protein
MKTTHWLTPDGTVACNPRDREAAHRAGEGKLAVADDDDLPTAITCRKCRVAFHRFRKQERE